MLNKYSSSVKEIALRKEMQKILFFNKVFDGAPDAKLPVRLKKRHQRNLASSHLATVKRALRCFCKLKCRAAEELTSPTAQPRWPEGGKSKRQHEYPMDEPPRITRVAATVI